MSAQTLARGRKEQHASAVPPRPAGIIINLEANQQPLPPKAELGWWYQYYFATERGRRGYSENRREFNKLIWRLASPKWDFDGATYDRTAASFGNPDHVDIVIQNYRWRLSLADGERQYDELEARLFEGPVITVPTITIGSDFDGAGADGHAYAQRFSGPLFASSRRRHWAQRAPGSARGVRRRDPRSRRCEMTLVRGAPPRSLAGGGLHARFRRGDRLAGLAAAHDG